MICAIISISPSAPPPSDTIQLIMPHQNLVNRPRAQNDLYVRAHLANGCHDFIQEVGSTFQLHLYQTINTMFLHETSSASFNTGS